MPISSQVPIIGYVANGVTKSFAFPFAILSADDLKVKVGADVVTAGFSIAGVGDRDGGSVTFTDAPASLAPIILYREVTLDRTTDYQENGDLLAVVLDDDLDRIWMALQDQLLLSDRALRSPLGETLQQLPPASERALMALAFDEDGNPIVVRGTNDGGAALALDLMDAAPGKGAELVGVSLPGGVSTDVKSVLQSHDTKLQTHDTKLQNLDTALNFSTLPVASSPVADTDLMVLRQGGANKQLQVSVVRAEFATNAVAAAAGAVAAKTAAEAAKTAAEAARDATVVGAAPTVYATTAAGLAATTSGKYFSVPSATSSEYLILYLNNAGVAVEQKRYPSSAVLDGFLQISPEGYAYSIADQDNKVAFAITNEGTTRIANAQLDAATATSFEVSGLITQTQDVIGFAYTVIDQDGKICFGIKNDGTTQAASAQIDTLNGVSVAQIIAGAGASGGTDLGAQNFAADIVHFPVYGQSLSTGVSTDAVLTTAQRFDNLRFVGGVRAQDGGTNPAVKYASLVPLVETAITPAEGEAAGTWARETPVAGATDYIKELIASENGIAYTEQSYQLLGSAPGLGAQTIANLSKPGTLYSRLVSDIQYGYSLAQAAGKSYKTLSLSWLQGESDSGTDVATYASALNQLRIDFNADVKAITGQSENVVLITYQTKGGNAALGQLLASESYSNIVLAGPHYFLPKTDGTHFTAQSSKIFGAYLGIAYKRTVIDGATWLPLKPIALYKQGAIVNARFHVPKGKLVFDTTTVSAQANNGFSLVDSSGNPLTISSVSITGPDTVRIVAAAAVPAGARLQYARSSGAGNLRDTQGLTKIFGGNGINYAMHNWCVAFDKTIS